jgi:amidohydrolase
VDKQAVKDAVVAEIDRRADDIINLSDHIMRNPETGYREYKTAEVVAGEFAKMGVPYRDGLALTGVKARLTGASAGPTVAVLGELDSLIAAGHPHADPVTNAAHACGHNAQIAAMLGAGMGLRTVMDRLDGDVVLFATPAEEGIETEWRLGLRDEGKIEFLNGKPELIRLGEFDDVDMAMMTHTPAWARPELASVGDSHNGSIIKYAEFFGNALKAAMLASSAIDAQRDTFRDEDYVRVHLIMPNSGGPATAVPIYAQLEGKVRGKTLDAIADANDKTDRSLRAGALAVGARVEITTIAGCLPNHQDPNLVRLCYDNCVAVVGQEHMGTASHRAGSADLGDLSYVMPVLHPHSGGVTTGSTHSTGYHVADHRIAAVNPAKWMAMTVIDLLWDDAGEARKTIQEAGPYPSRDAYMEERRKYTYRQIYDGLTETRSDTRED